MKPKVCLAYVTAPDRRTALKLGRKAVEEGLAACANVIPGMKSVYRWKGKIRGDSESVLILKARSAQIPKLKARIKALHPYENPCFLVLKIDDGLPAYLKWLMNP